MLNARHPKKPVGDWPSHYITYRLYDRGTSYDRISREHHYSRTAAQMAIKLPWPKMERLIAEAIGVTPQEIWPSRYEADGTPKRGLRSQKHSTASEQCNVETHRTI